MPQHAIATRENRSDPKGDLGAIETVRTNSYISRPEELKMDWDRISGNWKQFAGKAKEQWGKLTDDDLAKINGKREQLEGKLQERYGYAKDQSRKEVDDWINRTH
jgi:uncharacterized protein YjbJ (UPF0337 family)